MRILGISAWYHDAAAALLIDGKLIAAAQEERFTRIKHDPEFPKNAIQFCLEEGSVSLNELDAIVYYEKPFLKFERILETFYDVAPRGITPFVKAMPTWFREKLFIKNRIHKGLRKIDPDYNKKGKLLFPEHHLSHAASAFYPSNWDEAAILTIDGVGEWASATIAHGKGSDITILKELHFPHSVGLLYSAFTQFLGFKVNSGEYKLMGLAGFGEMGEETARFQSLINEKLVSVFSDGSIELKLPMFGFRDSLSTVRVQQWEQLFDMKLRKPEEPFSQSHANLALAIQQVTEEIVIKMAAEAVRLTGYRKLCMAGGVALNGVANGKLERSGVVEQLYIQPAAGDAGGALGAVLAANHLYYGKKRHSDSVDSLNLLGPAVSDDEVKRLEEKHQVKFEILSDEELFERVSKALAEGQVVGWCQGRMEFGPRALGNRSILADPRYPDMQKRVNLLVKKRESFRPFAPAILAEKAGDYFDLKTDSPHMLKVYPLKEAFRSLSERELIGLPIKAKLEVKKSDFPAIIHADFSCRVQTVSAIEHPRFHALLASFFEKTGCPMLLNTSFNQRGEPIVATAEDALAAFVRTGIDMLVINNSVLSREAISHLNEADFEHIFSED